jgi:aryl-alcohol dehydrogenase-like predicted oxidoreductase
MTSIDTAPLYGFGLGETILGKAIAGRRDAVQILTKVGLRWDDARGERAFETLDTEGQRRAVHINSRPDSVRLEVERSLKRLGVDYLDIVQVHRHDSQTPIAETMGTLNQLREEGKLRNIGVSNYQAMQVRQAQQALGNVPLASNQVEYSLLNRDVEGEISPIMRHLGIDLLAYSPLAQGLLASARRRSVEPVGAPVYIRSIRTAVDTVLTPMANDLNSGPGPLALAWLLHQPGVAGVVAGCRNDFQVLDNARAAAIVLRPEQVERIRRAFEAIDPYQDLAMAPRLKKRARLLVRKVRRRITVARVTRA